MVDPLDQNPHANTCPEGSGAHSSLSLDNIVRELC